MYTLSETEQHLHASLRDAILLLCQTGLKFNTELSVDGLLAVTVDKKHVFLMNIKDTLQAVEQCGSSYDLAYSCTDGSQEEFNVASISPSGGIKDHMLNGSIGEYARSVTSLRLPADRPSQCADDAIQLNTESLSKSVSASRRRQRKQRRTVRRILDAPCRVTPPSAVSMELPDHSDQVLGWTSNRNGDVPVYSDGECENGYCNSACKTHLLYDDGDHQATAPANSDEQTVACHGGQKSDEADSGLLLATEDQNLCESEMLIDLALPDDKLVTDSCHTSKQSHCEHRQYLDPSIFLVTTGTSSTTPLESSCRIDHIPVSVDIHNGKLPIVNKVEKGQCKMELPDNFLNGTGSQTECQDLTTGCCQSTNVKAENVEQASCSTELSPLGHNIQSSSDPQQQMAMMSQFGLSAVVANMQSHIALLPKSFPWSVRTIPSLSPTTSLPLAQSGTLLDQSNSVPVKSRSKSRCPKTPLNIPTVNSYRRLSGVKGSPFLSPEVNICANCGVTRTTVWRRMENKQILCNACGCYYKLHKVHRPLSLVRQEIRSRCRGPKVSTIMKSSKSHCNGVVVSQQSSPDVALNLTTTLPRADKAAK